MSHDDHRQLQENILRAVLELLRADDRVLGVAIGGSHARGEHTGFSDIDVTCWLQDEAKTGRADLYERVGSVSPLMCKLWVFDRHALYLYMNGVRLDLDFLRPDEVGLGDHESYRILFDPDGALAATFHERPNRAAPDPLKHLGNEQRLMDWLFWMFRQTYCWAKRSASDDVRWFDKRHAAIQSLAEIRSRLIDMRLALVGRWDYLTTVDPALAEQLADSYPKFETADVCRATRALLVVAEKLCASFGQTTEVPHRAEKFKALWTFLNECDGLPAHFPDKTQSDEA